MIKSKAYKAVMWDARTRAFSLTKPVQAEEGHYWEFPDQGYRYLDSVKVLSYATEALSDDEAKRILLDRMKADAQAVMLELQRLLSDLEQAIRRLQV